MKLDARILRSVCDCVGECMLWRLGVTSSKVPTARIDGKTANVRRYVYEVIYGRTPRPGYWITTRCGDHRCLAPGCLIQRSPSDSIALAYRKGRRSAASEYAARRAAAVRQGITKLTMDDAREIRRLCQTMSNQEIARKYGVSRSTVRDIRAGSAWREAQAASSVFAWRPA